MATPRVWTPEMVARLTALADAQQSQREMTEALGRSEKSISVALTRHRLTGRGKAKGEWPVERMTKAKALLARHGCTVQVARALGVTKSALRNKARQNGWPVRADAASPVAATWPKQLRCLGPCGKLRTARSAGDRVCEWCKRSTAWHAGSDFTLHGASVR